MEMLCGKGHSRAHHVKGAEFFAGLFISFVAALGSMSIYGNIWMYRFIRWYLPWDFFPLSLSVKNSGRAGKGKNGFLPYKYGTVDDNSRHSSD